MLRRRAALLHYGVGVGWGWGGAASYLDCSLDRGLLHRLTESAPMMSRKSSALLRCNLFFFAWNLTGSAAAAIAHVVHAEPVRPKRHNLKRKNMPLNAAHLWGLGAWLQRLGSRSSDKELGAGRTVTAQGAKREFPTGGGWSWKL